MAATNFFSELKFCREESVASTVTHEPQREEIEALRKELATARSVIVELRALIADRDAKIVSLKADVPSTFNSSTTRDFYMPCAHSMQRRSILF
jgi:hypothetical protein